MTPVRTNQTPCDKKGYGATLVSAPHRDFLASIVVFLVALPLCMGIAIASGVPVAAGLITGIVGGLVVGWISGSPLQVSGPAAGLTVIVYELVRELGLEVLGLAVLVAGILQLIAGTLGYGRWFRAVSPSVISGMLAGIGVLIFASQFHVMVDDKPKGSGIDNLMSIPQAVWKGLPLTPLGSPDQRQARRELLVRFETIHAQQVLLRESVAERIPHVEESESSQEHHRRNVNFNRARLEAMIRQQEEQIRELAAVIRKVHDSMLQEKREADVVAAAEEAADQMRFSLQMLQEGDTIAIRKSLEEVEAKIEYVFSTLKSHDWAAKVGLLTIVVLVLWNSLIPKKYRVVPAPLAAVIAGTVFAALLSLPIIFVEVPDNLWDAVMLPTWTTISTVPWFAVVQAGVVLAVVASAETLLCATAVDRMQSMVRTNYDRELAAQGVGNIVCGLLGALPMTGVIVRSSANVDAGARTRLSTILHGVWLLVFVSLAAALLRMIPTASLAAILVYTGYKLVNWKAVFELKKYGWGEVVVYIVTLSTIVATDLLTGVLTGVFLSAARLLLTFARLDVHLRLDPETNQASLDLDGAATFLSLPRFAEALEQVPPDAELHVDFEHLTYIDHACLDLLMNWAKQHEQTGGQLVIDWNTLHSVMSGRHPTGDAGTNKPAVAAGEVASK